MPLNDYFNPKPSDETPVACKLSALDAPEEHEQKSEALFAERDELRKVNGGYALCYPGTIGYAERRLDSVSLVWQKNTRTTRAKVIQLNHFLLPTVKRPTSHLLATALFTFLLLALVLPSSGKAQATGPKANSAEKSAPVEVMILGTFHFEGAPDFADVMAPEQQAQIQAVVDSLAGFQPTKIALEEVSEDASHLDSLYQAYRNRRHDLTRNERQQLGFRLADRMGHEQVYAIDYSQPWPFGEVMAWARKHEPSFIEYYEQWQNQLNAVQDSLHRHATVGGYLRWLNSSDYSAWIQEVRMRRLELGAGTTYVGLKPITSSYERDLRIFANLTRIVEPGDRILVIYGATHGYTLREFVRHHPDLRLVDARDYL